LDNSSLNVKKRLKRLIEHSIIN